MKKIEGVQSAEVRLNEGVATIQLKPGNRVSVEKLREVVSNNGFTPRQARVRVQGQVISTGGTLQLQVTGLDRAYDLKLVRDAQQRRGELAEHVGKLVSVQGWIRGPKEDESTEILEVDDFEVVQ